MLSFLSSHKFQPLAAAALLLTLATVVYIPAMQAGYIWDDVAHVVHNETLRRPDGLVAIWTDLGASPAFYPLLYTTFWLEYRLTGLHPTGTHVINIALHALSAVAIWRVLRRLPVPGAFVTAAIFAVHPVAVESVAWITERKNTLSMLFFALAMLTWLRFEDERRWGWYALALLTFLMALLSKTSVIMMPVVLLILVWWRRNQITWRDLLSTAVLFRCSLMLGLITIRHETEFSLFEEVVKARPEGFMSRLAAAGWCVWFYLYKAFVPLKLSMVYPRWRVDPDQLKHWLPLAALFATFLAAWWYRRTYLRHLLFTLLYFVVMLIPVLGFFNIAFFQYSLVADHFQYVALIGPIALVVAAITTWLRRWPNERWAGPGSAAIVVAVLCILTWKQAGVYQNEYTLWRDVIRKHPRTSVAYNNAGEWLRLHDRIADAQDYFDVALKLKPDYIAAHNNLGLVYHKQKRYADAVHHFHEAIRLEPFKFKFAYLCNLGVTLHAMGKTEQAIARFYEALQINPDAVQGHLNLGVALQSQGRVDESIGHFRKTVELKPDLPMAHFNLGLALHQHGALSEAIGYYRRAMQLDANHAGARRNLDIAMRAKQRRDQAANP